MYTLVQSTPNRGFGVFATHPIERGQRILKEKLIFIGPPRVPQSTGSRLFDMVALYSLFNELDAERRNDYLALHVSEPIKKEIKTRALRVLDPNTPKQIRKLIVMIAAIAATNIFFLDTKRRVEIRPGVFMNGMETSGVFMYASRFNHSCCANAYWGWNDMVGALTVHAIKDIAADEEITVAYLLPYQDQHRRQQGLSQYDFICTCPACDQTTERGKTSENRRERILRLKFDLDFFFARNLTRRMSGPLNTAVVDSFGVEQPFQAIEELERLLSAEELTTHNLSEKFVYPCSPSVHFSPALM